MHDELNIAHITHIPPMASIFSDHITAAIPEEPTHHSSPTGHTSGVGALDSDVVMETEQNEAAPIAHIFGT